MIVTTTGGLYTFMFYLLLLSWPLYFHDKPYWCYPSLAANTIVFVVVNYYVGKYVSLYQGLNTASGSFMIGCANITIIYIFPALLIVYLGAVLKSMFGVIKGRDYSSNAWANAVLWYQKNKVVPRFDEVPNEHEDPYDDSPILCPKKSKSESGGK